jgi:anti-sigma regulatory factor (Ser/Thr protein kinase)
VTAPGAESAAYTAQVDSILRHHLSLALPFDEFRVWGQQIRPELERGGVEKACLDVLEYVCTELLNNVVDHSGARKTEVAFDWNAASVVMRIDDDGTGAFEVVRQVHGLASLQDAALLLPKGKVTSDPQRHTGEGLFFSARACEWFFLQSGSIGLSLRARGGWIFESPNEEVSGTRVRAHLSRQQVPDLKMLFDEFCPQPELRFTRTVVHVGLLRHADGELVSRSQGKRLVLGLDKFLSVTFDFNGVQHMQQGFADEVFRVWKDAHPGIQIDVVNAAADVKRMLLHVGFDAAAR